MSEQKYRKAARVIVKAGALPFPISAIMIEILKTIVSEEELDLIMAFRRKPSQTMEELKQSSKMSEEQIQRLAQSLAKTGFIFNQPSSSGIMIYRLMPLVMVGVFEYTFMKKVEFTDEEKKLAKLFAQLFEELADFIQDNYDTIAPFFENLAPYDRTVPILEKGVSGNEIQISVNEELDVPKEKIMTSQKVEEIVNKFDDIAVGNCFCRHHKDLLGHPCKITDLRENCLTFGKSARYCAEQGFARMISKDEAIKILKESEKDGLIHKAFHPGSNISKDETSICNCCKDCCGTLEWWRMGVSALINWTSYLSNVDESLCVGCGTCVEKCPVDAIKLNDDNKAEVNKALCIGCGVCAHNCPENAISLLEGLRKVYDPLPKIKN